ncbi:MAG: DJ-1 family glyoxalase III [Candidatus Fimenecus sp.]
MIYVFLADGFEEVEALAPVDILRRAGLEVQTVGVTGKTVMGRHNIPVTADIAISEMALNNDLQAVVLPGGLPGADNLHASSEVQAAIDFAAENGKYLCAICAAPFILGKKGLLNGKTAICYPGFENDLHGAVLSDSAVCRDGNCITAKGMGVAVDFGLQIVAALKDCETADKIRESIQCV